MVMLYPLLTIPILLALIAWVITVQMTKIISLASVVAAVVLFADAVLIVFLNSTIHHAWPLPAVTGLIAAMVFWKHRSNIGRILQGKEPKVGATKKLSK